MKIKGKYFSQLLVSMKFREVLFIVKIKQSCAVNSFNENLLLHSVNQKEGYAEMGALKNAL